MYTYYSTSHLILFHLYIVKTCSITIFLLFLFSVNCVSVVPLLCHFIAECGHDEGGIIVGREVSLTESFSVMNVILVADPITVLTAMEKGN